MKRLLYLILITPIIYLSSCSKSDSNEDYVGYNCVDGSCVGVFTNPQYLSLNSCNSLCGVIVGCTDSLATNYNPLATIDDGSCLYPDILGCTDSLSINYNPLATIDDASCIYTSDVVFFEDVAAAVYFDNLGIQFLDISVEGQYVGTLQANLGFTYIPDCYPANPDAVNFTVEWVDASATTFTWTVIDEFGQIHYSGNEVILANDCLAMELTWKKIQEYKESK